MVKTGKVRKSQNDRLVNPPERSKIPTNIRKTPIIFSTLPKCLLTEEKKLSDFAKNSPNNIKGQPNPAA